MGHRRAPRPPRHLLLPLRLPRLRNQLPLRLRPKSRRLPARRPHLCPHDECRRRGQGLAAHRLLLVGDPRHRDNDQPRRLRHRLPRCGLLQSHQIAGAEGQGNSEENGA
ncbi:hypothetical protein KSP40_PGU009301 [Platanthera guangdongensis]|uniref:Uncharacterized protein n=1 Tax=Platanthera guangdongensis TaxID=2320717 RepID=A0ABR2LVW6_9ASPA